METVEIKVLDYIATTENIMENFKWAKVLSVMKFLDWTWRGEEVTEENLKKTASYLLSKCYFDSVRGKYFTVATGGLKATYYVTDTGEEKLELEFILTSW